MEIGVSKKITKNKIKELNIDIASIKKKLTKEDIEKIKKIAGKDSELIMKKLDELTWMIL